MERAKISKFIERATKCISTLPLNLYMQESQDPSVGYEVWSLENISAGVRFGPYRETFIDVNKNEEIGFQCQVKTVEKESMILDMRNENESNWLLYVNYTCNKEESNMITFHTESGVYYITSRSIPANTELLVYDRYSNIEEEGGCKKKETENNENPQSNKLLIGRICISGNKEMCSGVKDKQQFTSLDNDAKAEVLPLTARSVDSDNPSAQRTELICCNSEPDICSEGISLHTETFIDKTFEYNQIHATDEFSESNDPMDQKCRESSLDCKICSRKFIFKSQFKIHKVSHIGASYFGCCACGLKFSSRRYLSVHHRKHTGETIECNICGRKFSKESHVRKHQKTHTGEKHFECNVCRKKFLARHNLKAHQRIHTGEKPFECNVCGMKFVTKSNLKSHEVTHTDEKPFECDVCAKRFGRKVSLRLHEKTHIHKKQMEYKASREKFAKK